MSEVIKVTGNRLQNVRDMCKKFTEDVEWKVFRLYL